MPNFFQCINLQGAFLAPLGALIVSPFRDPVQSSPTYRFDCSEWLKMALAGQWEVTESHGRLVGVHGWKRMKVDESG